MNEMCDEPDGASCVRYLHISEVPDQYSIGIFVFAPHARIPLHDHPDMCVLSRVLYGDLQRISLDLLRDEDISMSIESSLDKKRNGLLGGLCNKMDSFKRRLPKGSRHALKKELIDHLRAPAVTVLYPYEGNLHEFIAGPDGAAVLDVLLPPYDNTQNRDCTFYDIHELNPSGPNPAGKQRCIVVPTGQPESFHCISGRYRDIGETDDFEL
jgi:plant cysteine oxidase